MDVRNLAKAAKDAAPVAAALDTALKNRALEAVIAALDTEADAIAAANAKDLALAEANGLAAPLLKRLKLSAAKLEDLKQGLRDLIAAPDPVGRIMNVRELDDGLTLVKESCPIGVLAMIFESRPDALVQIAGLALKSGNCLILKGGSEAAATNRVLTTLIRDATCRAGMPAGRLHQVESREDVRALLGLDDYIDLIIPRGSKEFVRSIMDSSRIPVLGHADGICHIYVHTDADLDRAVPIIVDAKTQYPAVCNALETLLIHSDIAPRLLPVLADALHTAGVELRGCPKTRKLIPAEEASEADWASEYLDLILSIKIVTSLDEAIAHINRYGSKHTDAVLCRRRETADDFMNRVDSANLMWNCSTRFADGYRYGLGAEVGISTGKVHARGPVGMDGLVIYKWKLYGKGQIVADYTGAEGRHFTHREIDPRDFATESPLPGDHS